MSRITQRLINLFLLFLVLIFILFEEIVWEGIAAPIYRRVHALRILQKLEVFLLRMPGWFIVLFFVAMLLSVEILGIYAGAMFVSGHLLFGATLYGAKIPIAAFTFWMFRVTEEKLMRFGWFRYLYETVMRIVDNIKSLEIYRKTLTKAKVWKRYLKRRWRRWKERFFGTETGTVKRIKRLYRMLKSVLKRG